MGAFDLVESWLDRRAIQPNAPHDDRFEYGGGRVIAPAITQDQFAYDMQRDVEAAILTNPVTMAYAMQQMQDTQKVLLARIEELENERSKQHTGSGECRSVIES